MELCQKLESDLNSTKMDLKGQLKEWKTSFEELNCKYHSLEEDAQTKEKTLNVHIDNLNKVTDFYVFPIKQFAQVSTCLSAR